MKVYIYKKESAHKKRERFGIVENVVKIESENKNFMVYTNGDCLEVPKDIFMISVYGY